MMKLIHTASGNEYDAIIFDGTNYPAEAIVDKGINYLMVELDSPSGDKITADVGVGTYLLTGPTGAVVSCPASIINRDYEVIL